LRLEGQFPVSFAEFVAFLTDIVANQSKGKEVHVICNNLSAHKTPRVEQFLADHPKVSLHYTPTYSSWLNQVELWFAKIERSHATARHRLIDGEINSIPGRGSREKQD
jgi:transposase